MSLLNHHKGSRIDFHNQSFQFRHLLLFYRCQHNLHFPMGVAAFTVKQRAENAVAKYNRQIRRSSFVKTQIIPRDSGDYSVIMSLDDEMGNLMTLELVAPDQRQAVRLSRLFEKKAETVYNLTMAELLDDEDELDN